MKKIQTDKEGFEIRYCNDLEEWTRISPCCKADVSCYGEGGACCRKCYAPLDDEYLALPLLDVIHNHVFPILDSISEFLKTKEASKDLGKDIQDELYDGNEGFTYCNKQLFIYRIPFNPEEEYVLVLGNAEYLSQDISELEKKLYEYAVEEEFAK